MEVCGTSSARLGDLVHLQTNLPPVTGVDLTGHDPSTVDEVLLPAEIAATNRTKAVWGGAHCPYVPHGQATGGVVNELDRTSNLHLPSTPVNLCNVV